MKTLRERENARIPKPSEPLLGTPTLHMLCLVRRRVEKETDQVQFREKDCPVK